GSPMVVPLLIKALGDTEPMVRVEAAQALGERGDQRAIAPLIKALEDDNSKVRAAAAKALGKLAPKK
ncbi:MAG: HEAT repeat domain-containing protein, partial [Candidatus Freyarchaeota archaeon]|nr:HEAT repeat domain-containing protein [Candidatus Jordarchaeia archaeon]